MWHTRVFFSDQTSAELVPSPTFSTSKVYLSQTVRHTFMVHFMAYSRCMALHRLCSICGATQCKFAYTVQRAPLRSCKHSGTLQHDCTNNIQANSAQTHRQSQNGQEVKQRLRTVYLVGLENLHSLRTSVGAIRRAWDSPWGRFYI